MRTIVLLLFGVICLVSCRHEKRRNVEMPDLLFPRLEFENKRFTVLKTGERCCFFIASNSCCRTCLPDFRKMNHLKYIGKFFTRNSHGKDGATVIQAIILEAKSIGKEEFFYGPIPPLLECTENLDKQEKFVVQVKN